MELGLICGIVLAALTLSLVLKKDAPAIACLLVLTAGAVLTLSVCLPLFEQVLALITEWAV